MYDLLRFSFFLKESAIGKVSYEVINSLMTKIMNDTSLMYPISMNKLKSIMEILTNTSNWSATPFLKIFLIKN